MVLLEVLGVYLELFTSEEHFFEEKGLQVFFVRLRVPSFSPKEPF